VSDTPKLRVGAILILATFVGYRINVELRPRIADAGSVETVGGSVGFHLRAWLGAYRAVFFDPVALGAFAIALVLVWPYVRAPY
jgi:hypothetical protein